MSFPNVQCTTCGGSINGYYWHRQTKIDDIYICQDCCNILFATMLLNNTNLKKTLHWIDARKEYLAKKST